MDGVGVKKIVSKHEFLLVPDGERGVMGDVFLRQAGVHSTK